MAMASKLLRLSAFIATLHSAQCHSSHNEPSLTACVSDHCELNLSPDLTMRYQIHLPDNYDHDSDNSNDNDNNDESCKECKINVQMQYDGYTWLGIGVSLDGKMIGSHAIIGQPGVSGPKAYYMKWKDKDMFVNGRSDFLEDASIDFIDEKTILEFTTTFLNWGVQSPLGDDPMGISLNNPSTFIWAHGNDGETELMYHGPGNKSSRTIGNLMSSLSSSSVEESFNSMTMTAGISSSKSRWLAHGIMAFLAFGVFAPLAITTAILRDCYVPSRWKEFMSKFLNIWLYLHVGLNTLTFVFTVVVFSLAVSTMNREGHPHWDNPHSKMGLAIFIIASFQVLGGYLRPSSEPVETKAPEQNNEQEDGISNENSVGEFKTMPMKSTLRQTWELLHNLFGIALFLFGVWQMYEGIELYHGRYGGSSSTLISILYIVWMALWTGIIVGGTTYKWFFQTRELKSAARELEIAARDINGVKDQPSNDVDDDQEFT